MKRAGLFVLLWLLAMPAAQAAVGKVAYVLGEVWIERHGERLPAQLGMPLERRDIVATGEFGRAKLMLRDGTKIYVGARSRIELARYVSRRMLLVARLHMFWGRARFFVHKLVGGEFAVETTTAVLGVRGTSFLVITPTPPNLGDLVKQGLHRDFTRFRAVVKQPTRVVLTTGSLVVQTVRGAKLALSPGRMALVSSTGEVKVMQAPKEEKPVLPVQPPAGGKQEKGAKAGGAQAPRRPAAPRKGAEKPVAAPPKKLRKRPPVLAPAPVRDARRTVTNTKLELGPNTKVRVQFAPGNQFKGFVVP